MTPEQRAEKIANICILAFPNKPDLSIIAAEIQTAVDEAEQRQFAQMSDACDAHKKDAYKRGVEDGIAKSYSQGFRDVRAEEREECAKIAENAALQPGAVIHVEEVRMVQPYINGQEWGNHIASRIRARATHEAGEGENV